MFALRHSYFWKDESYYLFCGDLFCVWNVLDIPSFFLKSVIVLISYMKLEILFTWSLSRRLSFVAVAFLWSRPLCFLLLWWKLLYPPTIWAYWWPFVPIMELLRTSRFLLKRMEFIFDEYYVVPTYWEESCWLPLPLSKVLNGEKAPDSLGFFGDRNCWNYGWFYIAWSIKTPSMPCSYPSWMCIPLVGWSVLFIHYWFYELLCPVVLKKADILLLGGNCWGNKIKINSMNKI